MNVLENYYEKLEEPAKSCLLALRTIILNQDKDVSAAWKYGMPFFCYKGKMFCYLWVHKKHRQPYIGQDLPIATIKTVIQKAIDLYKTGVVKVKQQ
jgi:hypothetical protein